MIYLDASLIVKFYLNEAGTEQVAELIGRFEYAATAEIAQIEVVTAIKQAYIKDRISRNKNFELIDKFQSDVASGVWRIIPISNLEYLRWTSFVALIPKNEGNIRALDAIHLISASQAGFEKIYTHDTRMISMANWFGLTPIDPCTPPNKTPPL